MVVATAGHLLMQCNNKRTLRERLVVGVRLTSAPRLASYAAGIYAFQEHRSDKSSFWRPQRDYHI